MVRPAQLPWLGWPCAAPPPPPLDVPRPVSFGVGVIGDSLFVFYAALRNQKLSNSMQPQHTELSRRVAKEPVLRDHERLLHRTGDGYGNDGSHPGAGARWHPLGRNMAIVPQSLRNASDDPCASRKTCFGKMLVIVLLGNSNECGCLWVHSWLTCPGFPPVPTC